MLMVARLPRRPFVAKWAALPSVLRCVLPVFGTLRVSHDLLNRSCLPFCREQQAPLGAILCFRIWRSCTAKCLGFGIYLPREANLWRGSRSGRHFRRSGLRRFAHGFATLRCGLVRLALAQIHWRFRLGFAFSAHSVPGRGPRFARSVRTRATGMDAVGGLAPLSSLQFVLFAARTFARVFELSTTCSLDLGVALHRCCVTFWQESSCQRARRWSLSWMKPIALRRVRRGESGPRHSVALQLCYQRSHFDGGFTTGLVSSVAHGGGSPSAPRITLATKRRRPRASLGWPAIAPAVLRR